MAKKMAGTIGEPNMSLRVFSSEEAVVNITLKRKLNMMPKATLQESGSVLNGGGTRRNSP
jgi:hypothetical protein